MAASLTALGIGTGSRVVIYAEPSPGSIAALLGVMATGASAVPLDLQLSATGLASALSLTGASVAFADGDAEQRLRDASPSLNIIHTGDQGTPSALPASVRPEITRRTEAAVFFTSGTTGTVKGVPLSHANIAHQINALIEAKLIGPSDTMLLPLPIHHVYPLVIGVLLPLALGMGIVLPASLTGPEFIRGLRDGRATVVVGVPRLFSALLEGIMANARSHGALGALLFRATYGLSYAVRRALHVRAGKVLLAPVHRAFGRSLDVVASGGAPLRTETAWRLEAMGWRLAVGYGLTETSPILTLDPPGRARIGSVGLPLEGVTLRLATDGPETGGRPGAADGLATGERTGSDALRETGSYAEVLAKGPSIFAGYLGDEESTAHAFTEDGWFRTGDLGRFDDDGYLYLSGRKSSLIVTEGGENVWPEEIEDAYVSRDVIAEMGVFERSGRLQAVVVPDLSAVAQDQSLNSAVREAVNIVSSRLPSYQRITEYAISRHALDRTRLGKVRRHLLAARYDEARAGTEDAGRPLSSGEMTQSDRRLLENPAAAEIWDWFKERYPDLPLSLDTSLRFDLGIDSLEWLSLTMAISQRADVSLDEATIAGAETIRELLEDVSASHSTAAPRASVDALLEHPEDFLTDEQKRSLRPHNVVEAVLATALTGTIRGLTRAFYHLRVEGVENVPTDGPFLITPNHVSFLDPFVLGAALGKERLRNTYWSAWVRAAFSNPLKRGVSRLAKTVPIDAHRAAVSSLALGAAVLNEGHALVWFPEGTRSIDGRIGVFKPGVGLLLESHRVPALPVIIHGSYEAWPVGKRFPGLNPIRVVFGKPVDPDDLEAEGEGERPADRIADALRARMIRLAEESA